VFGSLGPDDPGNQQSAATRIEAQTRNTISITTYGPLVDETDPNKCFVRTPRVLSSSSDQVAEFDIAAVSCVLVHLQSGG
jgi:hypothetical protein